MGILHSEVIDPIPFSGWAGPRDAQIVAVGEAWGREESEVGGLPFVGEAGKELWRMLGEAWPEVAPGLHSHATSLHRYGSAWVRSREPWLTAASLALTNVFNFRPENNDLATLTTNKALAGACAGWPALAKGKYLQPQHLPSVERLHRELGSCRPNLVIAFGNTACWALLRATNIGSIRGALAPAQGESQGQPGIAGLKVLPTYHPAGVLRQWAWRPIVVADLMKARREGEFPEIRRPQRQIIINPELSEVSSFVAGLMANPPSTIACDTETSLGLIDTISFASSRDRALACQVGPHRVKRGQGYQTIWPVRRGERRTNYWEPDEEREFWRLCRTLLESQIPKVFQNGLYDLQYLMKMGIRPQACTEDPMLLHHALFPELQKGLGFLGSIYTSEPAWKLMRGETDTEKRDE